MATITANISASETLIPLSAEVEIGFYSIDSENVYVTGMSRGAEGRDPARLTASVNRAVGGSTAASHTSGATLTRYYPDAAAGAGGLTNPLLEPFSITSTEAEVLVVNGAAPAEQSNVVLINADGSNVFEIYSDGSVQSTIRIDDTGGFEIRKTGGSLTGVIATFSEYGSNLVSATGGASIFYADRETANGGIAFFQVAPVGQQGPIADATTEAEAVTQLNLLLAAMRAYGLLDT